jgi:hypothetical protein
MLQVPVHAYLVARLVNQGFYKRASPARLARRQHAAGRADCGTRHEDPALQVVRAAYDPSQSVGSVALSGGM